MFSNLKKNAENDGFGLGLFIVNNFVKDLHGSFELSNNDIAGCTAQVAFELEIDEEHSINDNYFTENKII